MNIDLYIQYYELRMIFDRRLTDIRGISPPSYFEKSRSKLPVTPLTFSLVRGHSKSTFARIFQLMFEATDVNDVVPVFLLLTLIIFHTLLYSFYC